jgi:hypothetical protein
MSVRKRSKTIPETMRDALTTIFVARRSNEAEEIIGSLKTAGLHPAELALTTPVPFERSQPRFPIEVPFDEIDKARTVVENGPQFVPA